MSELERDMQLLAEEIIAAPATSLAGLRAPLGGTSGQLLPRLCVRFSGRIMLAVRCGRRDDRPHADGARARGQARGRCGVQGWWRVVSRRCAFKAASSNAKVSAAGIRLNSRKIYRAFKGIICGDISEFESYMGSQAVWSHSDGGAERWATVCSLTSLGHYCAPRAICPAAAPSAR